MRYARLAMMRGVLVLAVCAAGILSGCAVVSDFLEPRVDPEVKASVRTKMKSKRIIAVAFEGKQTRDGRENAFRFDKSALLDKALVELRHIVVDRGFIQSFLESHKLPETGSFKSEDLQNLARQSGAEVLILGYSESESRETLLGSRSRTKVILRAVDLKTLEVVNSVQGASGDDDAWLSLVGKLLHEG